MVYDRSRRDSSLFYTSIKDNADIELKQREWLQNILQKRVKDIEFLPKEFDKQVDFRFKIKDYEFKIELECYQQDKWKTSAKELGPRGFSMLERKLELPLRYDYFLKTNSNMSCFVGLDCLMLFDYFTNSQNNGGFSTSKGKGINSNDCSRYLKWGDFDKLIKLDCGFIVENDINKLISSIKYVFKRNNRLK